MDRNAREIACRNCGHADPAWRSKCERCRADLRDPRGGAQHMALWV